MPLHQFTRGARAIIGLNNLETGDHAMLRAMGLYEGSEVTICHAGHNCIVQIESTRLGISRQLAQKILAIPCACASTPPNDG